MLKKATSTVTFFAMMILAGCAAPQGATPEERAYQEQIDSDVKECVEKLASVEGDVSVTCGAVKMTRVGTNVLIQENLG